jgi:N-acyl-L-homoserine lactone synthetase
MRGRVLYANGRRPEFKTSDGQFLDRDEADQYYHHLLLRNSIDLVGCCRVTPLEGIAKCTIERELGDEVFKRLLKTVGHCRKEIGESSRWLVRDHGLGFRPGLRLIAGIWAMSVALNLKTVIAIAGTRDGQAAALERTGARRFPGVLPFVSPKYDDEVVPMYFDLAVPSTTFSALIVQMADQLSLKEQGLI